MLSRAAGFLGTTWGFWILNAIMAVWVPIGFAMEWSSQWLLLFTVFLSVLAIETTGIVLVGQRDAEKRMSAREKALQHKADSLVAATPEADNALIGSEETITD